MLDLPNLIFTMLRDDPGLSLVLFIITVLSLVEYLRVRRLRENTHQMNVKLGAPLIPKLERDLTPLERETLAKRSFIKNNFESGALSIIVYLFLLFFALLGFNWSLQVIYPTILLIVLVYYGYKYHRFSEQKHLDLISPVTKITGYITYPLANAPMPQTKGAPFNFAFFVADQKFLIKVTKNDLPEPGSIYNKLTRLDTRHLVSVEYTPHSRTVLQVFPYSEN